MPKPWGPAALSFVVALAAAGVAAGETFRFASWNVANNPNDAADLADLTNVLDYSDDDGLRWSLLSLAETDTESIVRTVTAFNGLYGGGYVSSVTNNDAGGDRTGFVYDTTALQLIDFADLSAGLTHNVGRGTFQAVGGSESFTAYSIHLKSGGATADADQRRAEADVLVADALSLGTDNLIFLGAFNWNGSGEGSGGSAYDAFASITSDPVGGASFFRDNPDFLRWHTQDPGGAMDDRFDAQLHGDGLVDGLGWDYLDGTYRVLGNNGSHQLNQTILTGTGAPSDVLASLAAFSDHLPTVADYELIAIPEPTALAGGLGLFALLLRRRR